MVVRSYLLNHCLSCRYLICRHVFWRFPMSSDFVHQNIRIADIMRRQALDISGGFDGINCKGY
ncbi:MAG: hypothetical protein ACOCPU_03925 [Methanohalophilus sp.]